MSPSLNAPAVLLAGNASHAGKTTTCLALTSALLARGLVVRCAKSGPDYIDARYHAVFTAAPCANLDVWMGSERAVMRTLGRIGDPIDGVRPDILLIEGAMGLFDGDNASSAKLACLLDFPVILLLDATGCAESIAALALGFFSYAEQHYKKLVFKGVIVTKVGTERHAELLKKTLDPLCREWNIPILGLLPKSSAPKLFSRHLGLVSVEETRQYLDAKKLAQWCEQHINIDKFLRSLDIPLQKKPRKCEPHLFFPPRKQPKHLSCTIAIASDSAFSFAYADLPALLEELSARIVFFSPIKNSRLPACDGVIFPGGYPELETNALAANRTIVDDLRRISEKGAPIYGECGGFMYLMKSCTRPDGQSYPMSGLLPCSCIVGTKRAALGYREARLCPTALFPGKKTIRVRGHEFHYGRMSGEFTESAWSPLWRLYDKDNRLLGYDGVVFGSVFGSWLHVFPEGGRPFFKKFIRLAQTYAAMSNRH
ncbi:MAG: cobyrinate a,c-diamide synthase [Desulfovibrio sp.]|nr:cobyrinate a,c-diamide synthase [Desulfovibrio sp.]